MKFDKVYAGIIAVLVVIIIYLLASQGTTGTQGTAGTTAATQENISSTIKQIYDLQFETNTEVLKVEETNGIYKVVVRFNDLSGRPTTQDIFVTKDGKLITDRLIVAENYRTLLEGQKGFIECLSSSGVRILGQINDTATLQQLQMLGTYSYKLFISCDGANEATCKGLGVSQYPTTIYNNSGYTNVYAPAFYSQLTNCTLG